MSNTTTANPAASTFNEAPIAAYDAKYYNAPESLDQQFNHMSFQEAGGAPSTSRIPTPPPLPSKSFNNSHKFNKQVRTRNWGSINHKGFSGLSVSFILAESFGPRNVILDELRSQRAASAMPANRIDMAQHWSDRSLSSHSQSFIPTTASTVTSFAQVLPAVPIAQAPLALPAGMLAPPINDGRRYARLTGQKRGSRRSRKHLVQPLNNGLTTVPAGLPLETLGAAPLNNTLNALPTGRRGRKARRNNALPLNNGLAGTFPLGNGLSALPLASSFAPQQSSFGQPLANGLTTLAGAAPIGKPSRSARRRANRRHAGLTTQIPLGLTPGHLAAAPLINQPLLATQQPFLGQQQSLLGQQIPTFVSQAPMMTKQESYVTYSQPSMVGTPMF